MILRRLLPTVFLAASLHAQTPPIVWHAWSDEVFAQAARDHKFVLLDLEAVWCHWCHVMDQQTYSNPAVRRLMAKKYIAVRVFSVEYRSAVAQRMLNGESVMALYAELKIKRSVLYRWRDAYRKFGQDGFKKTSGRPPGKAAAGVAKPAGDATASDRRIAELEQQLGRLAFQNDFLEKAFRRVKEARSKSNATGEARCTKK